MKTFDIVGIGSVNENVEAVNDAITKVQRGVDDMSMDSVFDVIFELAGPELAHYFHVGKINVEFDHDEYQRDMKNET